jgi:hypothetical protein
MASVDPYVLEPLMRDLVGRDKSAAAYLVYLFLWSRAADTGTRSVRISHNGIAEAIGISRSAAQAAIHHLNHRKLIRSERATQTSTPEHFVLRPWLRRRTA